MKAAIATALAVGAVLGSVASAPGEVPRADVIWARTATGTITLDGVLNEPEWAMAETMVLRYGQNAGIPGRGWKVEAGLFTGTDPTVTTVRFLVKGNQLFMGAVVQDSSVGGSDQFNRFDGLLMAIKDHGAMGSYKPPSEYFYSWWYPDSLTPDPQPPGQLPYFIGSWATFPPPTPRDSTQLANWDAVTTVQGLSNDDSVIDQGYTVEMRFNLTPMGYDVTQPAGDVVEWNLSVYDADWFWPFNAGKFTANRVWWQSPWGNTAWYNEVKVHARPDVTTSSGPVPQVGPELVIAEVGGTAPTIDGALTDAIWSDPDVYSFDIRWGDVALRDTYPGVGPHRAGEFQPTVNGGTAFVVDPADATVKIFHQGDNLYLGFDVRDLVVQHHPAFDRWDGVLITMNEYSLTDSDHQLMSRRISFQVGATGAAQAQDYLGTLVGSGDASVAIQLNPGTTVDTLGTQADNGYTAELVIDLTGMGYPSGLGDGRLFLGMNLLDGDSFLPVTDSYGTRTWWFREYENECCPVWAYLAPNATGADLLAESGLDSRVRVSTVPNPSANPAIRFALPSSQRTTLEIFDVTGRLVERRALGIQGPGEHDVAFDGRQRAAGVYLYRVRLADPATGRETMSGFGKLVLLK
jgi:hypothetical protein